MPSPAGTRRAKAAESRTSSTSSSSSTTACRPQRNSSRRSITYSRRAPRIRCPLRFPTPHQLVRALRRPRRRPRPVTDDDDGSGGCPSGVLVARSTLSAGRPTAAGVISLLAEFSTSEHGSLNGDRFSGGQRGKGAACPGHQRHPPRHFASNLDPDDVSAAEVRAMQRSNWTTFRPGSTYLGAFTVEGGRLATATTSPRPRRRPTSDRNRGSPHDGGSSRARRPSPPELS
jgi:hypothetical protein